MPRARRGDRHRSPRPGGALVRLGEVVIGREDAESALEAWERAEKHFSRGTLGQDRLGGERRRARIAGRLAQQQDTDQEEEP